MEQTDHKDEARTEACRVSILNSKTLCPVFIIVGMEGAGKASLIEHITDVVGLSRNMITSAVKKPQIIGTTILGRETFFIHAPGFSTSNASYMFHLMAQMIDELRSHITIQGVWHVIQNTLPQETAFSSRLLEWLSEFCGREYYPFITIVTTYWGCTLQEDFLNLTRNFEERRLAWEKILGTDIETYQHGKWYNMSGQEMDQVPTLSWYADGLALRMNAKEMTLRRCAVMHDIQPAFLRELNEGKRIEDTAAARVLKPLSDISHPSPPTPAPAAELGILRVIPGSVVFYSFLFGTR